MWLSLWETHSLEELTPFCLWLAMQDQQCVGILNLLVWASVLDSPQHLKDVIETKDLEPLCTPSEREENNEQKLNLLRNRRE